MGAMEDLQGDEVAESSGGVAYAGSGSVALVLNLTEGEVSRTLTLSMFLADEVFMGFGDLTIDDGVSTTTLAGALQYDAAGGAVIDPNSQAGFAEELAAMLHAPEAPGRAFNFSTVFTFIGNIVSMVVNSVIDVFIPYTPPVACSGPGLYLCLSGRRLIRFVPISQPWMVS